MILANFKPFFPYIKRYRREITIGLIALLAADLTGLVIPWLLKEFIDLLPENPSQSLLIRYSALLFFVACIQAVSRFGWQTIYVWHLTQSGVRYPQFSVCAIFKTR